MMIQSQDIPSEERFKAVTRTNVTSCPEWEHLDPEIREGIEVVSAVLPFRANRYVMEQLIDWDAAPDDPIFRLTFPHADMLDAEDYTRVRDLLKAGDKAELDAAVNEIRFKLNPHPAGQTTHNVPMLDGEPVPGIQHKYRQTMLFFPAQGQTCHAYCTFCFRWAQFVGLSDLKFANRDADQLVRYLREHKEITDVLFTGGDPMIMKAKIFKTYIDAIIEADDLEHIQNIRIGSKSLGYWPQRFVSDGDADDMLRVLESIVESGRTVALMGHYSHPVELAPPVAQEAIRRVRNTGTNIRMQSPLIRRVNDDPGIWANLWQDGVRLGCIPYYMFVERDTGARGYFEVPLVDCHRIFSEAYQQVSGLARTVRGPSMSAFPGKVHVLGVRDFGDSSAFILQYLQCRRGELVRQPFMAKFDATATWFDELVPFTDQDARFFPGSWDNEAGNVPNAVQLTVDGD